MIHFDKQKRMFHLSTCATSYVIGIDETGHLLHLYYGAKLGEVHTQAHFLNKRHIVGSTTNYEDHEDFSLNHVPLEAPSHGKGDYREPLIHIEDESGFRAMDFLYHSHETRKDVSFEGLPQAKKGETLIITLKEKHHDILLKLYYTAFEDEDALVKNLTLTNDTDEAFTLDRILSSTVDFLESDYDLLTLDGAWIRERHMHRHPLRYGVHKIDSKKGVSSSDHNPFFALLKEDASEAFGDVYGFNLIYSGNFEATFEKSPHDMLRVNMGLNSFDFKWRLEPGETFTAPEAVLSFSDCGLFGMRKHMHDFIKHHLNSENRDRPIKVNNWEATYFDFNEKKLLAIAKKAKRLGIECFCLDDGWFGRRDDDTSSLGDWHENLKKLPGGLPKLSRKIKRMGLKFGLWVEPEMVNKDSDLYSNHPDWVIEKPGVNPSLGRNQLVLDLSKGEVVDHLFKTLKDVFTRGDVDYVKWDMNRNLSDLYSKGKDKAHQGKLAHLYVLGLYNLLKRLKDAFPDVLFESCSSGGNRFDLGMLYYMPQTWTSDNTDAHERLAIQKGTALSYPQSSISNHVSDDISHQVLRHTPLETRFNVACFGVLGYELDLRKRPRFDREVIKRQTAFYKAHRRIFQYGEFHDLSKGDDTRFMVVDQNREKAVLGIFKGLASPNPKEETVRLRGLDETKRYKVSMREQFENIRRFGALVSHALPIRLKPHGMVFNWLSNRFRFKSEPFVCVASGALLMRHGLVLPTRFRGTGYQEGMRLMPDFSSRLYIIEEIEDADKDSIEKT